MADPTIPELAAWCRRAAEVKRVSERQMKGIVDNVAAKHAAEAARYDAIAAALESMQWRPIAEAPKDGTYLKVRYADGTVEDDVYWSNTRSCMLGSRAGALRPGWVSSWIGHLPVDDITHFMPPQPPPADKETDR